MLQAWPRSAQIATAFLLGVVITLLAIQTLSRTRWGSRPMELERDAVLSYRVDLNRAPRAELLQLPGIGNSMAQRIEDYRQASGGFRSVDDLMQVKGFGPATLERLRPWVYVKEEEGALPAANVDQPRSLTKRGSVSTNGLTSPASKSKKLANLTALIDINRASEEELRQLPGIGPKMSRLIVEEREKRPLKTVDELRRVPRIGPKTLERLRPFVNVQGVTARVVSAE